MTAQTILRNNLLSLARAYARASGVSLSTVSLRAYNDSDFFDRQASRQGSFTAKTYDNLVGWFRKNWPDGARWPRLEDLPAPTDA